MRKLDDTFYSNISAVVVFFNKNIVGFKSMNQNHHPDIETLQGYLDMPESSQYNTLRLHLATCGTCRMQVNRLNQLQQELKTMVPQQVTDFSSLSSPMKTALQEQTIERYVDGKLDETERSQIETLIKQKPAALKAALHYASHRSAMDRLLSGQVNAETRISVEENVRQTSHNSPSLLQWLQPIKRLLELRTPLWFNAPVTAIAIVLLVTVVTLHQFETDGMIIAGYQDDPVVRIQSSDRPPGIGFFSKTDRITKPFKPISVQLAGTDALRMSWPAVENAASYTIKLEVVEDGRKLTLGELTTDKTNARFDDIDPHRNRRYEWTLTGQTNDAKTFYARGGFVINHR